jgi:hypothetical protein
VRSGFESSIREGNFDLKIRFSAAKYSFRKEQFLVDRAGHVSQKSHPAAVSHSRLSYTIHVSWNFLAIRDNSVYPLDNYLS